MLPRTDVLDYGQNVFQDVLSIFFEIFGHFNNRQVSFLLDDVLVIRLVAGDLYLKRITQNILGNLKHLKNKKII